MGAQWAGPGPRRPPSAPPLITPPCLHGDASLPCVTLSSGLCFATIMCREKGQPHNGSVHVGGGARAMRWWVGRQRRA